MKCEARHVDTHMSLRRGVFKRLPRVPACPCPVRRDACTRRLRCRDERVLSGALVLSILTICLVVLTLGFFPSCIHRPRREQVTVQGYSSSSGNRMRNRMALRWALNRIVSRSAARRRSAEREVGCRLVREAVNVVVVCGTRAGHALMKER